VLPLTLVAALAVLWAVLTGWDLARSPVRWIESLPGGGLLRDGQKWLAPWWLLVSAACGAAAGELRARAAGDSPLRLAGVLTIVPILLLPDLAGGAAGRLSPHEYPADWDEVGAALTAAADDSAVVSLPWSAFRRYAWNGNRVVLDPAPRYLPGEVIGSSDLLVRGSRGGVISLPSDDPDDGPVAEALASADPVPALQRLGVGWVLVQRDQPAGPLGESLAMPGSEVVFEGSWLTLLRLPAASPRGADPGFPWATWLIVGIALIGTALPRPGRKMSASEPAA
jgi:hypothetical protein